MTDINLPFRASRKRTTSFYKTRWNKVGINPEKAAEVLGVTVDQVLEWDQTGNDLAERYLLLWDQKRINVPGWEKFVFTRGVLKCGHQQWTAKQMQMQYEERASSFRYQEPSRIDLVTEFRELKK